ncbi:MAG: diguanylate cyclase [Cellvibrio sp.]
MNPVQFHVEQARALQLVEADRELEVIWTFTTSAREEKLMPIRIPIDRGLFGWRIFLIKASDQTLFNNIENSGQLAKLRTGQGHDWPDTDILRANNFSISGSTTYEGLFDMLARNHIQYFPRSLLEAELELNSHPNHSLAIESNLVLHYPTALYFFVNKKNTELAADLEQGLRQAMADGSFKNLFDHHFSDTIRKANLNQRKIISVSNPLLPAKTPLDEKHYWFSPKDNY